MKRFFWIFGALFVITAAGCSLFEKNEPVPRSATLVPSEYRVGPSDVLSVVVWKQPDLSVGQIPIRPDGFISLPLVGEIKVAGLTTVEIKEAITERMKEYVTDPNVTVIVIQVNYPVAFVIGGVNRPGPVQIRQDTTMLQLVAMAGGFSPFANKSHVHLLRREGGKEVRIRFNYDQVVKGKHLEQNVIVRPGDVIVVDD
jgi:polysaccharide export outer membrane protein